MLFLYIFGPIVFVAFAIFAWVKKIYRPWKKRRAEEEKSRRIGREADELLARAEQGDTKAQNKLVDDKYSSGYPTRKKRLAANEKIVQLRRHQEYIQHDWDAYGTPTKRAYSAWQKAVGAKEESALCVAFVLAYDRVSRDETRARLLEELGFDYEEAKSRLQKMVTERYEMLVSKFSHDREAFLELRGLIPLTRDRESAAFPTAGAPRLRYPRGWNEAVARFLENPAVGEFVGQGEGPVFGQILQWGEEAFRDGDFVKAKLVLAYAKRHRDWRAELGDVLNHELGKLVAEYHASLVTETSAATEPSV